MTIEELLAAASGGPERLAAFLDTRGAEATPQLGWAARDAFERAAASRDWESALIAVLAAWLVFRRLGMEPEALRSEIDFHALFYMSTEDPERYTSLRATFQDIARRAHAADQPALVLDAAILAAESALHGMMAARDSALLTPTLQDTVLATRLAERPVSPMTFQRLVYLVAQVGTGARHQTGDAEQHALVGELACWARDHVADDFAYTLDARIDAQIAGQLTELISAC